jgi:hypothetical protein
MDLTASWKAAAAKILQFRGDADMRMPKFVCCLLSLSVSGCDFALGLDIMNSGNETVEIAVGSNSQNIAPGLSFHGTFPAREDHAEISVANSQCHFKYMLPDLDREPWHSLIGKSFKLRWFSDGRLVAYPPTPDVRIRDNPQRANSVDASRTIQPYKRACR